MSSKSHHLQEETIQFGLQSELYSGTTASKENIQALPFKMGEEDKH